MGKHLQSFNEHSKNEKLDLSGVSDSDFDIINNNEAQSKKMYMMIDTCSISLNNKHIKNSIEAITIVLHFFKIFCTKYNINCGNLYVVKYNDTHYYGCCDGLSQDDYSTDKDCSIAFDEFCTKNNLILDDGDEDE